jgi:sugar/nucleoside kinase (ribokinase family)
VIGNLARDVVDGGPPRVGGGPYYGAQALRLVSNPSRVVTKLASADEELLLPGLLSLGVPVEWRAAAATSSFRLEYHGERRRTVIEALGETWSPEEASGWVDDALADAEWVHVAPLARTDFPAETLAALADGRRLSLDGQGLVRPGRVGELQPDADYDRDVLRHLQVLKLAEEEAAAVLDHIDHEHVSALGVPEVLVTLGPRGSIVFAGKGAERVQAIAVDADPTGAGDVFMAAYVAARSTGIAPVDSARSASRLVELLLAERAEAATA